MLAGTCDCKEGECTHDPELRAPIPIPGLQSLPPERIAEIGAHAAADFDLCTAELLNHIEALEADLAAMEKLWAEQTVMRCELHEQIRSGEDPKWDATDGAHPAWWRGHDHGAIGTAKMFLRICKEGAGPGANYHAELSPTVLAIVDLRDRLAESQLNEHDLRAKLESLTVQYDNACVEMSEYMVKLAGEQARVKELEAKLAEAEQRAANTVARADANEVRAQQLEAKLVDAERQATAYHLQYDKLYLEGLQEARNAEKRAEAAEARCRTLTDALFAATGGHVDLDKLVDR